MLPGLTIGVPLNIYQQLFTTNHYGYNIIEFKDIILQFSIGYYIYGNDRYNDYKEDIPIPDNKLELYNEIQKNELLIKRSLDLSLCISFIILLQNPLLNFPFIGLIGLCNQYKLWKPYVGIYKPLVISILWTCSCVIMPCVLHDHNYEIIKHSEDYIPCVLTLCSTSNYADIKDIQDDINNDVSTFPVIFGKQTTIYVSIGILCLSSFILENRDSLSYNIIQFQNISILLWFIYNYKTNKN